MTYRGLLALLAISLCVLHTSANIQVGNTFSQGVNLLSTADVNCSTETRGVVRFYGATGGLQYCDGTEWSQVSALDAGAVLSVLSPQLMQDYVFCFNRGVYTRVGGPGSSEYTCECYSDGTHGYYSGERCEDCLAGWEEDSNGYCVTDVDECSLDVDGCTHICLNTQGSFECSCNTGYVLDGDQQTCLDVTAPVVTINTPEVVYAAVGATGFVDPGASALDEVEGDLSSSVTVDDSAVNYNVAGTYSATYSVSDSSGNTGTATRTIVVHAGFQLSETYGDSMVLQREPLEACVTGTGPADWAIEGTVDGSVVTSGVVDTSGHWKLCLPPQPTTSISGSGHVVSFTRPSNASFSYTGLAATMSDVLFGDVFMCSGQSNMYQILWASDTGPEEVANLDSYPHVRLFKMELVTSSTPISSYDLPQGSIMHQWHPAGSNSAAAFQAIGNSFGSENRGFSGVCWYFGRFTSNALNDSVPIGLIDTSWPGSNIETYMPDNALSACSVATGSGTKYNHLINPFLDTTITGAVWYQGESNAGSPTQYECLFREMITGWRENWDYEFPFFFVQLAGYDSTNYAAMRQSQATVISALDNVGMAAAYDVGDRNSPWSGNIHPRFKRPIGRRLSLAAQNILYGLTDVEHRGPQVKNVTIVSQSFPTTTTVALSVEVEFDHVPNSMFLNGTKDCTTCCTSSPFEIGGGGSFVPVDPVILGQFVTFTATVPINSVTFNLRYAHSAYPECAMYRDDGDYVPAEPFNIRLPFVVDLPNINVCSFLGPGCDQGEWELTHEFAIPDTANYNSADELPYSHDCSATDSCPSTFERVGYFLQLDNNWVWVSVDPFTQDASRLGIPIDWDFQTDVAGMHVESNVLGTHHHTAGRMEFWSNCYRSRVTGFTDDEYDAYDEVSGEDCFGTMQFHFPTNTPVFAFNAWSCESCEYVDLGIGSASNEHRDWTFEENGNTFGIKRMSIFVSRVPVYHPRYERVFELHMPPRSQFATVADIPYNYSCIAEGTCVSLSTNDRVAYMISLGDDYAFVELDSFTTNEAQLGVPSGQLIKQAATGVSAQSSLFTRRVRRQGNVEFWDHCYGDGANDVYDYDDDPSAGSPACFGSMQIFADTMTLFGYNSWASADEDPDDFTIGPGSGTHPDGTHLKNGGSFSNQVLTVFAAPGSGATPAICDVISPGCDDGGWQLTYDIDIPSTGNDIWLTQSEIPYTYSCLAAGNCPSSFSRIGYYLQLDSTWIWLSMDAFTTDGSHTGIPMTFIYDGPITNYHLETNQGTLPSIDRQATGSAELWPNCYGEGNGDYNHDDSVNTPGITPCYGSMQFFRQDGTVLFAFNGFSHESASQGYVNDIGIGPNPDSTGHTDYTFAYNTDNYSILRLMTFVR